MNPILALMQVSNLMKGKNPEAVYNQLMQSNPQFKQFIVQPGGYAIAKRYPKNYRKNTQRQTRY